jgi:hypothetical protein
LNCVIQSICAVIFDKQFWNEQTHAGVDPSLLEGRLSLTVECAVAKCHIVNHAFFFQIFPFYFFHSKSYVELTQSLAQITGHGSFRKSLVGGPLVTRQTGPRYDY